MKIEPSTLEGIVKAPSSKSVTHRALICAALSGGKCKIGKALVSDDTIATAAALRVLGAGFEGENVDGTGLFGKGGKIHCGESGSTLRFMLPLACLSKKECVLDGTGRLKQRPIEPLVNALNELGAKVESSKGFVPVKTKPGLEGGECTLPGGISSQFISSLLLSLPLCGKESFVKVKGKLESKPYVDLTLGVMKEFVVEVQETEEGYGIKPQKYVQRDYTVEGDWSSAAFWMVAGAIGGKVKMENLKESRQADYAIVRILERMGVEVKDNTVEKSGMKGCTVDVSQCPDLVPILAVAGCFAEGKTILKNAERLRLKESDRLTAIEEELVKMGGAVEQKQDELVIHKSNLSGATLDSHGDHRIAMALSIAACYADSPSTINGAESVSKSYPGFYNDFRKLGGKVG